MSNSNNPVLKNEYCTTETVSAIKQISKEYIIPDYLPDIERILMVSARPEVCGCYAESGGLEAECEIVYTVIFLSDEKQLKSINLSDKYVVEAPAESIAGDTTINASVEASSVTVKLLNQRKINASAIAEVEFEVNTVHSADTIVSGKKTIEDEIALEKKVVSGNCVYITRIKQRELTGSVDLRSENQLLKEILFCDTKIIPGDCRISGGELIFNASAEIECIVQTENNEITVLRTVLDLNEIFELKESHTDPVCITCKPLIGNLRAVIVQDSYAENRNIEVDFTYTLSFDIVSNNSMLFTEDLFSTNDEVEINSASVSLSELIKPVRGNCSLSLQYNGNLESGEIPLISRYELGNRNITLSGEKGRGVFEAVANISVITAAVRESGGIVYRNISFTAPVKCEFDIPVKDTIGMFVSLTPTLSRQRMRADSRGINIDTELSIAGGLYKINTFNYVKAASLLHNEGVNTRIDSEFLFCYTSVSDSLWDIAKRYRRRIGEIERINDLKEKSFKSGNPLKIPLRKAKN